MSRRAAVLQSNYIPWRGYFDILNAVDDFVIYDVVQFTKNDWRNRNRIKTPRGAVWLTIPVLTSGRFGQTIAETDIADRRWAARHWRSVSEAYARAPFFADYREQLEDTFRVCGEMTRLSQVNRRFIEIIASWLGITTRIHDASDFVLEQDRNSRLIGLCRALRATEYLSGPSAAAYLDRQMFAGHGIDVYFADYSGYRRYPQGAGDFDPSITALDLIFHTGPEARRYLLGWALAQPGAGSTPA